MAQVNRNFQGKVRSEKRTVRPFVGISSFDGVLKPVRLQVGQTEVGPNHTIPDHSFLNLALKLYLPLNFEDLATAVKAMDLKPSEVDLVVFATGLTFKKTAVVARWTILEDPNFNDVLAFGTSEFPQTFGDSNKGFDLSVALVLNKRLGQKILRPYLPGTWLSKVDFSIRPERLQSSFAPTPMDSTKKVELKIPGNSLFYLDIRDSVAVATDIEEAITLFVDAQLLGILQSSSSPVSRAITTLLARQAISSLIHCAASNLKAMNDLGESEVVASLMETKPIIWQILLQIEKDSKRSFLASDLLIMIRTDPEKVITIIDSQTGMNRELLGLFNEVDV